MFRSCNWKYGYVFYLLVGMCWRKQNIMFQGRRKSIPEIQNKIKQKQKEKTQTSVVGLKSTSSSRRLNTKKISFKIRRIEIHHRQKFVSYIFFKSIIWYPLKSLVHFFIFFLFSNVQFSVVKCRTYRIEKKNSSKDYLKRLSNIYFWSFDTKYYIIHFLDQYSHHDFFGIILKRKILNILKMLIIRWNYLDDYTPILTTQHGILWESAENHIHWPIYLDGMCQNENYFST